MTSEYSKSSWTVRRDIEVGGDEKDDVGESIEIAPTAGAVLGDLQNSSESFGDGVGQIMVVEGRDVVEVCLQRAGEPVHRRDADSERGDHPATQELLCSSVVGNAPELSELVFEHPRGMNMASGMTQAIESVGLSVGARGRVAVQQLAQALVRRACRVVRLVHGFGDAQSIEEGGGVRAMMLYRLGVSPLCQNSCRVDTSVILGALRSDSGSIRQRIQSTSGGSTVTT